MIAARQIDVAELLEDAGFDVDLRTRPLQDVDGTEADLAVVFRGRLIGRNQAAALAGQGIPVIEILTVEPPSRSTADWIQLSNRITKSDLVQIVQAMADGARERNADALRSSG